MPDIWYPGGWVQNTCWMFGYTLTFQRRYMEYLDHRGMFLYAKRTNWVRVTVERTPGASFWDTVGIALRITW